MQRRLGLFYLLLITLAWFLWFCKVVPKWGWWYSEDFVYQKQVERLLEGHLSLSASPAGMALNYAWGPAGVQQVWGLGVPVWRLPFEWAGKKACLQHFPDRLSFVFFMLISFYGIFQLGEYFSKSKVIIPPIGISGVGFVFCLSPPFLALCLTRFTVYEEVAAYGFLFCCLLLSFTIQAISVSRCQLIVCLTACFLAGMVGFIRPTLLAYGLASVIILCFFVKRKKGRRQQLITISGIGILFAIGVSLLFYTNFIRFGAPLEFGHSLNINGAAENVYASRFDYPFRSEPVFSSLRELGGALFFKPLISIVSNDFGSNFFWGQSSTFRWRNFYFSTYDLSFFIMTFLAWGWLISKLVRQLMHRERTGKIDLLDIVAAWSLLSGVFLAFFYMRFPFISSRYLLDFAPSLSAAVFVFWCLFFRWVKKISGKGVLSSSVTILALVIWWGCEVNAINSGSGHNAIDYSEAQKRRQRQESLKNSEIHLPDFYTADYNFQNSGIPLNGNGWEKTGDTMSSVCLFVENPQNLILELSFKDAEFFRYTDYDCIQAKIGLDSLKRRSIKQTENGAKIVFETPARQYQRGIQLVFIGMIPPNEMKEGKSDFRLQRVDW